MSAVSLNCLVYGDEPALSCIFDVDTTLTENIARLREKIWNKTDQHVPAKNLFLYVPKTAISTADKNSFENAISQLNLDNREGNPLLEMLNPTLEVAEYAVLATAQKMFLHIVVVDQIVTTERVGKRERMDSYDAFHVLERWRAKRIKTELPTIAELSRISNLPLSHDEKIPISANRIQSLFSTDTGADFCALEDVEHLFRVGEGESFLDRFFFTVSRDPPTMGTEKSFISFWDENVRNVLELLFPNGRSTRNSNLHTATGSLRPDYAFLLNKLCVFRGVEKAPDSTDDPKQELATKTAWAYGSAPYVLGYYTTGPDFTLVAISPPLQGQSLPIVHHIASANLRLRKDRIRNICRLINLAGLFQTLADLVRPSEAEFILLERDRCTVEIAGHKVIKSYTSPDKFHRVLHLRGIYHLLKEKGVPHVDALVHHFGETVVLSPRGIAEPPKTEQELLKALICVLEALEVLHNTSPPVFHRDIRWPNVIRCLDDPQSWFIIDWDDAATPPTTGLSHFRRSTHAPGVFIDGHGPEVDMWSVGELILRCGALDSSSELKKMGKWMQGSIVPSAQEALGKIKDYQSSHL